MEVRKEDLRRYYSTRSDEELLEIDRSQLTEVAQACYDEEIASRGLQSGEDAGAESWPEEGGEARAPEEDGEEESWLEDAFCVCTFDANPGSLQSEDAERAREALDRAGIPCHISVEELQTPQSRHMPQYECRVLVPGPLGLKATSLIDVEIFNPQLEAQWRMHFEHLSDDELRSFDGASICAGLLDRAARLKKAYGDEVARRKLK